MNAKLLIIDGMNILRRVYEANLAPDSQDKALGALNSTMASLRRALKEHTPTHALIAMDAGGVTWRHVIYPAYKQNRKPMPAPLAAEIPTFNKMLADAGWATIAQSGVEADDTIASLAIEVCLNSPEVPVTVLSTDKDLGCLSQYGVKVFNHFTGACHDEKWSQKKFGVAPTLILDLLALTGDKVDDIPGVAGVGIKTAQKLLQDHGSLEAILTYAKETGLPGKIGKALVEQADQARLSRQLTALRTDLFKDDVYWCAMLAPTIK